MGGVQASRPASGAAADRRTAAPPSRSRLHRVALLAILILIVTAAVVVTHWPALSSKAISFDDQAYLVDNNLVQKPGWASARQFFCEVLEPSTIGGYYQPLAMISLMLDYAQAGRTDNLRPFHRTSLALHAINTSLIIVLLYLLLTVAFGERQTKNASAGAAATPPSPPGSPPAVAGGDRSGAAGAYTGLIWAAAMVGLLFGLHPLTVEPIPWVGERKTLLAAFFALWCLISYVIYARRKSRAAYAACLLTYVLALMAKPTSTPLPALMLLLDFWPLRRLNWRAVTEKVPFFVIGAASAVITFISQARTSGVEMPSEQPAMQIPLVLCHNIIFYLYKMVRPVNLTSHYPLPDPFTLSHPMILAGVIGTCILIPALLLSLRRTRALLTGWLFFFVAIFPTMGVIGFTNVIASDKYAYLPSVGILLILAWLIALAWNGGPPAPRRRLLRAGMLILVLAAAGAEASTTRRYLTHWKSTEELYFHMIDLAPRAPSVRNGLGYAFASQKRYADAVVQFREALRLQPRWAEAQTNLGAALLELDRTQEALEQLTEAVQLKPRLIGARNNLGQVYIALGRYDEAIEQFREALRLRPNRLRTRFNLANALMKAGRPAEAIPELEEALRIKPDDAATYSKLADALATLGRSKEAIDRYNEAIRLRPDFAEAHNNLAAELSLRKRPDEALPHAREAIRLKPDFAKAHYNLGVALLQQNKTAEAVAGFEEAVRLSPDLADARNNLAVALLKEGRVDNAARHLEEAARLEPDLARSHYNLARVRERQGRPAEAIREYREALRLDPGHKGARSRLDALSRSRNAPTTR